MAGFGTFLTYLFFSLPQEEEKMSRCTLNILSVNVQIIYIIHILVTEISMVVSLKLNTLQGDFF